MTSRTTAEPRRFVPLSRSQRAFVAVRDVGVVAAVALAPFESEALSAPLGPLRLTTLEMAMAVAVAAGTVHLVGASRPRPRPSALAWAILAFVVCAAVAAIAAPEHVGVALRGAGRLALLAGFALAAGATLRDQRRRWVLAAFAAATTLVVALGAFEQIAGEGLLGDAAVAFEAAFLAVFRVKASVTAMGVRRLTASFDHANLAASWLAAALVVAAAATYAVRGGRAAAALSAGAIASAAALAFTLSRGGLAAALLTIALTGAAVRWSRRNDRQRQLRQRRFFALSAAIGATVALCGAASPALRARWLGGEAAALKAALVAKLASQATAAVSQGAVAAASLVVTARNDGWACWRSAGRDRHELRARCTIDGVAGERGGQIDGDASARVDVVVGLPHRVCGGEVVERVVPLPSGVRSCTLDLEHHGLRSFASAGGTPLLWSRAGPPVERASPTHQPTAAHPQASGRAALWRAALVRFAERPWLGGGPDTFRLRKKATLAATTLAASADDPREHANNLALEVLADLGLLGFLALLALALATLRAARAAMLRDDGVAVVASAAISVFALHGLVDCVLFANGPMIPVALAFGWLASEGGEIAEAGQHGERER